jgi:hypothetical protein
MKDPAFLSADHAAAEYYLTRGPEFEDPSAEQKVSRSGEAFTSEPDGDRSCPVSYAAEMGTNEQPS